MEAFTVLAVERLAKADRQPGVWGVVVFQGASTTWRQLVTQAAFAVHSVDESSAATALRSVVLMSQNSSQLTQYASMG